MARTAVGAGVDRYTGRPVAGWEHTVNSIDCIFQTYFGTRVLRRWFGSYIPPLLGRNLDEPTVLHFFTAVYAALYFEPRFQLTNIQVITDGDDARAGHLGVMLIGVYLPRAHLGEHTPQGERRIRVVFAKDGPIARSEQ